MKLIGIDIGTTTISAAVLDAGDRHVIQTKTVKNGSFLETGHAWERIQDVSVIVKKASDVLDELLERYPDTSSIGLTGQMHGIVYLNREGSHVSPLYTWQDGRANLPVFDGKTLSELVYETCKVKLATGYGLATHLYNLRQNLVPQDAVSVCTIADYVGMILTGRSKPLIHVSNAASLGFFDSAHGVFLEKELRMAGGDPSILPEVTDQISVLGEYRGIPVTAAIGDNQASFLGSVGFRSGVLLLNMGTGGQISVLSDRYFEAPGIEARPLMRGKYLLVGSSLCGGRAYAILERFFRSYVQAAGGDPKEQYEVMERLAEQGAMLYGGPQPEQNPVNQGRLEPEQSVVQQDKLQPEQNPMNQGRLEPEQSVMQQGNQQPEQNNMSQGRLETEQSIVQQGNQQPEQNPMNQGRLEPEQNIMQQNKLQTITAFNGTRANPQLRGSITNISEDNFTPAGLIYSVLEGMARELYEMYEQIRKGTGINVTHLVASGNGIRRNQILQQICSKMFGADLELAACEEEAACGAAVAVVHS